MGDNQKDEHNSMAQSSAGTNISKRSSLKILNDNGKALPNRDSSKSSSNCLRVSEIDSDNHTVVVKARPINHVNLSQFTQSKSS